MRAISDGKCCAGICEHTVFLLKWNSVELIAWVEYGLPSRFTIRFFGVSGFQKVAARIHIFKQMQARNVYKNSIVSKVYYYCFLLWSAQEG